MSETKKLMVCPLAETCVNQVIWYKPIWRGDKQVDTKPVFQGHCVKHHEMDTCSTCPPCVEAV